MIKSRLLFTLCICVLSFSTNASMVTSGIAPEDYSFFPTPSAWDPGADTARLGGFPAPGGATWSIMGAGLSDSGIDTHGSSLTTSMLALPGLVGLTLLNLQNVIGSALDVWASVSGFTNLGMVADSGANFGADVPGGGNFGDIRIGAISTFSTPGVLAHAYQPGTDDIFGAGGNIAGDVHFDNSESWFISDLNGSPFGTGTIDLLTVMIHELGHALGLGHSDVGESIMFATYVPGTSKTTLHADDIAGIQAIYGAGSVVVPVPAAVWLFGSGLLGLIGMARRKKTA